MDIHFESFQSYVAEREASALTELGYRVARSVKGILLTSTEATKWLVESRKNDTTLQRLYADWLRLSEQYAAFVLRDDYRTADSLWQKAAQVEKNIIRRLPDLEAFFPDLEKEPLLPPSKKGK